MLNSRASAILLEIGMGRYHNFYFDTISIRHKPNIAISIRYRHFMSKLVLRCLTHSNSVIHFYVFVWIVLEVCTSRVRNAHPLAVRTGRDVRTASGYRA